MSQEIDRTVNVDAHGTATADHDRVQFAVLVEAEAGSISETKAKLLEHFTEFKTAFAAVKALANVKVDEATLALNSSISKNQVYDPKKKAYVFKGFKGSYSASFDIKTPDEASAVYDVLTDGLSEFNVGAPVFKLKHQEALRLKALENAYKRLNDRFLAECRIIGKDATSYEIATWHANYGGNGGSPVRAMSVSNYSDDSAVGASMESQQIDIQAGKAIVTVYLTATFVPKGII